MPLTDARPQRSSLATDPTYYNVAILPVAFKDLPIFPRFSSKIVYSDAGVQPDKQVCIPRGKRQPQCRPVHRGRPAHTQSMVLLPEVHPRTVKPIDRPPRAQNPDAKSRGTRDNAVRLSYVEPARVPVRHAAPSSPQVLDLLHRLAKAQRADHPISYMDTLIKTGRGVFTQEADLVCRICGAHGGYGTAEVRDVRRNGGGGVLCGGPGKRMDGIFPVRPQSFRYQRTAAQDEGEWRRTAEQGAEHSMAEWVVAEKAKAGLRHAVVCPNVTGRTKERIAQSKQARAGLLALVDYPQVARTCIFRAFGLQMQLRLSLVLRLFCFASFSSLCFR